MVNSECGADFGASGTSGAGKTGTGKRILSQCGSNGESVYKRGIFFGKILVDTGTGIHGPKGVRITPKTGKALKFKIGGQVLYRKSVAGQKPNPYMKRAFDKYKGGGLERALQESGLGEEVLKEFRKAFKNAPNIKFS